MWHFVKDNFGWVAVILMACYAGYSLGVTVDKDKVEPSVIIALCALGFTIHQSRLSQKHRRLSVQPKIQVGYPALHLPENMNLFKVGIIMENKGLGIADICEFEWLYDGQSVEFNSVLAILGKSSGLTELHNAYKIRLTSSITPVGNGFYLKEGENVSLVMIEFNVEDSSLQYKEIKQVYLNLQDMIFNKLSFKCTYSSIYGDDKKKIDTAITNPEVFPEGSRMADML